jgi:GntR family transcriptional regulator
MCTGTLRGMPEVQRPAPAYVQIATHYRDQILTGELLPGDQLPPINTIAEQWHVSSATAAKAVSRLQVERAVYSTPQGTFVSSDDHITRTPGDRIRGPRPARIGRGEKVTLNEAGIVLAPNYVAELLGIEPGSMVIRREEITSLRGRPRMLSVDWIPTKHVMAEAELLGPATPEGPEHVIATVTGRRVTHAQDHLESREADTREAGALGIPVGAPILAGAHVWSDADGVILYGEWCMPPKQVVSYSYEVEQPGN